MEINIHNKEIILNSLLKQNKRELFIDIKETFKLVEEERKNGLDLKIFLIATIEEYLELKTQFNLFGCPKEINTTIYESNGELSAYRLVYFTSTYCIIFYVPSRKESDKIGTDKR